MKLSTRLAHFMSGAILVFVLPSLATAQGKIIFQDDFQRAESDDKLEEVGNGWTTNSKKRAKGVKQVDLVDGSMHITRAKVADHGVSVVQDLKFRDAIIEMRFKIGPKDDLGINIADMKEKSVHAGHICMTRIRSTSVEINDLKMGKMNLETRQRRLDDKLTDEDQKRLKTKTTRVKAKISPDQWHQLKVQVENNTMTVSVDGKPLAKFSSEGIGHATKSRLRLAVNKSAWVDDVKVTRLR